MALQQCGLNTNNQQKELHPHGTIDFPCAGYNTFLSDSSRIIPWHWHEELEIIYIKSGTILLQIPSKKYYFSKGDLIILNSNILHYIESDCTAEIDSFVFSPLLLTGTTSSLFYTQYISPLMACREFKLFSFSHNDAKSIQTFQTAFNAICLEPFAYEFIIREQLTHLVLQCFQNYTKYFSMSEKEVSNDTARLEKMLSYIHQHYFEKMTLKDIAKISHISERECLRCFKKTIQISPIQYLLKYRLMKSEFFLSNHPSMSIADIATACGFDHISYYSKQFKQFYQCSPSQYRKKHSLH